ncbi:DUF4405 domain-containing protein [Paenibacillus sp. Dod16]|uniref:DUF4405 domain-containing protein n=1 Tax=Paenibacillus sp. Dod16 TaxID=3416392 RepID=UPI003CFABFD6
MNRYLLFRLVIDLVMTVLMLVAMAYHITGNKTHEWVGVILLLLFIIHNILNRRWYRTIFTGKYHIRRLLSIAVNLLFLVSMGVVILSSFPISLDIFSFVSMNDDMFVRQIHVQTAYWGFIFMAVHIGMSWGTIINAVRRMTGITGASRIRTLSLRILAVLIVVYGVKTSFEIDMASKLTIYDPFGFWDESTLRFIIDYLSIAGIYICGTHYALKFVQKQKKAKAQK